MIYVLITLLFLLFFILGTPNAIHALLALILIFINMSILLFVLDSSFLAFSYILVYIGAISVLFLYIILLLHLRTYTLLQQTNLILLLSLIISVVVIFMLSFSTESFYISTPIYQVFLLTDLYLFTSYLFVTHHVYMFFGIFLLFIALFLSIFLSITFISHRKRVPISFIHPSIYSAIFIVPQGGQSLVSIYDVYLFCLFILYICLAFLLNKSKSKVTYYIYYFFNSKLITLFCFLSVLSVSVIIDYIYVITDILHYLNSHNFTLSYDWTSLSSVYTGYIKLSLAFQEMFKATPEFSQWSYHKVNAFILYHTDRIHMFYNAIYYHNPSLYITNIFFFIVSILLQLLHISPIDFISMINLDYVLFFRRIVIMFLVAKYFYVFLRFIN